MSIIISNEYIYMILNYSLYYINYLLFYVILIFLFKKHIIMLFCNGYTKYYTHKKKNTLILKNEYKEFQFLEINYKEKNKKILVYKNLIENYIKLKENQKIDGLEKNRLTEYKAQFVKDAIKKTLYENYLLEYAKNTFKNILFSKFNHDSDALFVKRLLKSEKNEK